MLQTRLEELGIVLSSRPKLERMTENQLVGSLHPGTSFTICQLLFTRHMTATSVAEMCTVHEGGLPLFVVGPRITGRSAEMFLQLGIRFLDQAGLIWFKSRFVSSPGLRVPPWGTSKTRRTFWRNGTIWMLKAASAGGRVVPAGSLTFGRLLIHRGLVPVLACMPCTGMVTTGQVWTKFPSIEAVNPRSGSTSGRRPWRCLLVKIRRN